MLGSEPLPPCCDVVVVGAGAAGLYAALCLPADYSVCLLTKADLQTGASDWAQGGIAAAIAPGDSPKLHFEDTLKAGAGLCDRAAVEFLVEQAPAAIARLVDLGVSFDRHGPDLALTLEAAHSKPRVLHAADTTGRAIVSVLTARVLERANIQVAAQAFALQLWVSGDRCQGVQVWHQGRQQWLRARAVVLATGGGGQVYAQTTNPSISTGDGIVLAWQAGAALRDLEFFQFHPTALTQPGAPHFLISEAVRGEGAHLVDAAGDRFAFRYHPAGELAPRDVVSRAIFDHLAQTSPTPEAANVFLDLRPIARDRLHYRFPNILKVCRHWGIDPESEPIPVAPAAHYWMGGIAVDRQSCTTLPGLYAIGETASTGVHGANRLASNSLLECLVYAGQLATLVLPPAAGELPEPPGQSPVGQLPLTALRSRQHDLQTLMWRNAGIRRTQPDLDQAIAQVAAWQAELSKASTAASPTQAAAAIAWTGAELRDWVETRNLLAIATLILRSAAFRTESRGGHCRRDYPQPQPHWQTHTWVKGDHWSRG
ncbi:MAG: L-aspartate oxidase [Spirulinaceae cyanobacterium SM2_1_0]|nr:L-aspartate oxidase [Spirulinaceae cyanobacterium SM2_1_0]